MKKIHIVTDCTSDLTKELIEKNQITVVPLYVTFGTESYRDGIDITTEDLYKKVEEYQKLPKTSAIPPAQFIETFAQFSPEDDVIFIGIGSNFSGTYQNAVLASAEFENVYVIDSQNLSSGTGLLLLKIAKLRDEGLEVAQIIEKINEYIPLVRTQFAINTLEYLHMGGRCSGTTKFFGTMLKIKPIIRVINGVMEVTKKPRGKFTAALDAILDYVRDDANNIDLDNVFITHSLAKEDADYLKHELQEIIKPNNLIFSTASGVISTHCGPRTIGILYIVNK